MAAPMAIAPTTPPTTPPTIAPTFDLEELLPLLLLSLPDWGEPAEDAVEVGVLSKPLVLLLVALVDDAAAGAVESGASRDTNVSEVC